MRRELSSKDEHACVLGMDATHGKARGEGGEWGAGAGEEPDGEVKVDEKEERAKAKRTAFEALQHSRTLLPMYQYKEGLLKAIAEYQVLVIVGETGSGKTTQVPPYHHFHLLQTDAMRWTFCR